MARRASTATCGSRRFRRAPLLVIPLLAAVVGVLVLSPWGRGAGSERALTFRLDHFQCYTVKAPSSKPQTVFLVDQFRTARGTTGRIERLCAPVEKNGLRRRNERAHLVCYALRSGPLRASVEISNQFQKAVRLTVGDPLRLCLPSGKSRVPGPEPQRARGLDHYECYGVRRIHFKPRGVKLHDQFGTTSRRVVGVQTLCTPVHKDRGRILNGRDHLVCYALRQEGRFERQPVRIINQFEGARLFVLAPESLCLPSRKRLLLPDLTVAIANVPTQVSCPGGGGTCITTVNFTIRNVGPAPVIGVFQVRVEADPGQVKTVSAGPLAAGGSQPLTVVLGPDGNCYEPDCTVRVVADSSHIVSESNESNNTDTRTDIG